MVILSAKVTRKIAIAPVGLTGEQMRDVAAAAHGAVRDRIRRGLDVNDTPARPLARRYEARKVRKGKRPVPDMEYTGQTMTAFGVQGAAPGRATLGFSEMTARMKAASADLRRGQLGFSRSDTDKTKPVVEASLAENVKVAVSSRRS